MAPVTLSQTSTRFGHSLLTPVISWTDAALNHLVPPPLSLQLSPLMVPSKRTSLLTAATG